MRHHPVAAVIALALGACGGGSAPPASNIAAEAAASAGPADMVQLGRLIFFDPSLSASGKMACSTCHDPAHAYGPANALAVQPGGPHLDRPGLRAVPSLRYALNRTPRWTKQFQSNPLERVIETDSVPTGGLTRDGRFNTLRDQAREPLLSLNEMANRDEATVIATIRAAPYAAQFERVFGAGILHNPDLAFDRVVEALERFQLDDPSFHPYNSKFDRYLQGQAELSAAEARGLSLFVDPQKGNCAACHIARPGADGSPPLFTDFTFAVLGVPRNPRIAANADPRFYDLGLCGPTRTDQVAARQYCGMFKTPSLRNVAARQVFMHNGVFTDLSDAVRFYASRDIQPARWYRRLAGGGVDRYDDLPPDLKQNVDVIDPPFDRGARARPALSEVEIGDIVDFLRTLTDDDVKVMARSPTFAHRGS